MLKFEVIAGGPGIFTSCIQADRGLDSEKETK